MSARQTITPHPQAAAAGYAAVYAYREQLKVAGEPQKDAVKRDTVASSLKFADAFPQDEHAAVILGTAADDMYQMKDYKAAIDADQRVIDNYPGADAANPAFRVDCRCARLVRAR